MQASADVVHRLETVYDGLSPRLRQAARYIRKNPTEVALYPLRQVAAAAGVSPTTLVRLATDLGFSGYNAFKDAFRDQIRTGADRYAAGASRLIRGRGKQGSEALHDSSFNAIGAGIEELSRTVSAGEIARAAEILGTARTVYLLGMRPMFAPAFYFAYLLRTFASNVVLIENRMDMLIDEIGGLGQDDVLLVVSYEPYSISAVKAVEYSAKLGAKVIALTDSQLSPVALPAAQVFVLPTASNSFYQSLVPAMALLETIASFVLSRSGEGTIDRVAREFERREGFGVYWQDGRR